MKLKQWLGMTDTPVGKFAKDVGVKHYFMVWRYLRGEQLPRKKTMEKIYRLTNGEVTPNDFYDLRK